jgi:hypothetical protein
LSDPTYVRRLLIAFAASIFVHAIIVGLDPLRPIPVREEEAASARVIIEQPTAKPPLPPQPTPHVTRQPAALVTPRPLVAKAIASAPRAIAPPVLHTGGAAAPRELATTVPSAAPNGIATAAGTGVAAGGSGSGAGPGKGSGGANGTDIGLGGGPCGLVMFVPAGTPAYTNKKIYETISVFVEFADGHREKAQFPYPWIYDSDRADPWSIQNTRDHPNMSVPLQTPPPSLDMSTADPLVKYVLAHSTPNGRTLLPLCPGQNDSQ